MDVLLTILSKMDTVSMVMTFIMLFILLSRITRPTLIQHVLWFGGMMVMVAMIPLAARDASLALDPILPIFPIMALVFMSLGYYAMIDGGQKWSPYLIITMTMLVGIYGLTANYWDGPTGKVLLNGIYTVTIIPAAIGLVVAPLYLYSIKKLNVHAIWASVGWLAVLVAFYIRIGGAAKTIAISGDLVDSIVFTIMGFGMIFVLVSFMMSGALNENDNQLSA